MKRQVWRRGKPQRNASRGASPHATLMLQRRGKPQRNASLAAPGASPRACACNAIPSGAAGAASPSAQQHVQRTETIGVREGNQNATKRSHCHCKARRGPLTSLTARIIAAASQRAARRGEQRGQVHPRRAASRPRASTSQSRIIGAVRAGALGVTATAAAATSATYQKEEGACQTSDGQIN
jgi:hypothetical protein